MLPEIPSFLHQSVPSSFYVFVAHSSCGTNIFIAKLIESTAEALCRLKWWQKMWHYQKKKRKKKKLV